MRQLGPFALKQQSLSTMVLSAALVVTPLAVVGTTGATPPPTSVAETACQDEACPYPIVVTEGIDESWPAEVLTSPVGQAPAFSPDKDPQQSAAAAEGADTYTPKPYPGERTKIGGYLLSTRPLQPIEDGARPYQDHQVRPVPFGRVDSQGVRMFRLDSDPTIWNHPVA